MLCAASSLWLGCLSVGQDFAVDRVPDLAIGETTRSDVERLFGSPWRTGIEDGKTTWTYGHYRYSLFSPAKTRDLVVRYDDDGVVRSFGFNSTYAEDRDLAR